MADNKAAGCILCVFTERYCYFEATVSIPIAYWVYGGGVCVYVEGGGGCGW